MEKLQYWIVLIFTFFTETPEAVSGYIFFKTKQPKRMIMMWSLSLMVGHIWTNQMHQYQFISCFKCWAWQEQDPDTFWQQIKTFKLFLLTIRTSLLSPCELNAALVQHGLQWVRPEIYQCFVPGCNHTVTAFKGLWHTVAQHQSYRL